MCVCWGASPHHKQFLDTSRVSENSTQILTLSTWNQHQIPQVEGSVLQDCHLPPPQDPLQMAVESPGFTCVSDQLAVNQRFPRPPPQIRLICQSSQNSGTFYLLDHQFIIKGYDSRTVRWKQCIGPAMGKRQGASMPSRSVPFSPCLLVFINPEALCTLSTWVVMVASFHRQG